MNIGPRRGKPARATLRRGKTCLDGHNPSRRSITPQAIECWRSGGVWREGARREPSADHVCPWTQNRIRLLKDAGAGPGDGDVRAVEGEVQVPEIRRALNDHREIARTGIAAAVRCHTVNGVGRVEEELTARRRVTNHRCAAA